MAKMGDLTAATTLDDADLMAATDVSGTASVKITVANLKTLFAADTASVAAAGALMDSEVDADIKTLVLPASTTISTFGASLVDDADAATGRATLSAAEDKVAPVTVTGTTDTLAAADHATTNIYTDASLVTVTIPTNATVALDVGSWTTLVAAGAGGLTLSTTGITLIGSSPNTTIAQNEAMVVQKTATDTWLVLGGTAA